MSKKISHEPVLRHLGQAAHPLLREIYVRVKAAYESTYDPLIQAAVSKTYELTTAGFKLRIAVCSPAALNAAGKEYIYIVLENDSVRCYITGLLAESIDYVNITTETLPRLFDFVDLHTAIEEITTTVIGAGWTFPVDTVVIEKT